MSRVNELECVISDLSAECRELREQVAAQAAAIEALRAHLKVIAGLQLCADNLMSNSDIAAKALAIPTDSTQILDEVRRAERKRCAKVCESHPDPEYTAVHLECARRILERE